MKLEELERRLRTDIMQEAIAWAGRVMLHKEVSLDDPASRQVDFDQAAAPSKLNACITMSFTIQSRHLHSVASHLTVAVCEQFAPRTAC